MAAQNEALHRIERGEGKADTSCVVAVAPSVDAPSDSRFGVEPKAELRGLERHEDVLSGLEVDVGGHEHSVWGQIEGPVGDDAEVSLTDDLAWDPDVSTNFATVILAHEKRHIRIVWSQIGAGQHHGHAAT